MAITLRVEDVMDKRIESIDSNETGGSDGEDADQERSLIVVGREVGAAGGGRHRS
jgi:hypothetical protein